MRSNSNINNQNINSSGGPNNSNTNKSDVQDQRYLQWLKNVQEELINNNLNENKSNIKRSTTIKNNPSQIQSGSGYNNQSNKNKFIYVTQYEEPLKKTTSLLDGQSLSQNQQKNKKQYLFSYDPSQQHKIKKCSQFEDKKNKEQNTNVIPISHRRQRSLSPIRIEEIQNSQNLRTDLQQKSKNAPKVSLQYYSKKWSSPQVADFDHYFIQKKQKQKEKQVKSPQYNSAQSTSKPKIFGDNNSNYSSLKKSSIVEGLEQKDQEYLKNVYPQTIKYLKDMIDTLNQDKFVLLEWKHKVKQEYFKAIEEKGQIIKINLFKIIEQSLQEWKQKQYKNIQKNQMKYLGELLQVEDMIEQRQKQFSILQSRLQQDLRNYRQNQADMNIRNTFSDILSGNHKDQIINLSKQLESAIQSTCEISNRLNNSILKQQISRQSVLLLKQNIQSCFQTQKIQQKQVGIIKSKLNQNKSKNNFELNDSTTKPNNRRFTQQQDQKPTRIKNNDSSKTLLKDYEKIYSDFRKDFDKKYQSFILQSAKQKNNITSSQFKAQKQKTPIKKQSIYSQ